jgi:hypothetical protein
VSSHAGPGQQCTTASAGYQEAVTAAQHATDQEGALSPPPWALVELIEAAVRSGRRETAAAALDQLSEQTSVAGTDWALGVEARSRALLSQDDVAENHFRESIERFGRTRVRSGLARSHLLYGEWLRREHRRTEAREQLQAANQMLDTMGMAGFAERTRRELRATGVTARKRKITADRAKLTARGSDSATGARWVIQQRYWYAPVHQPQNRPISPKQGLHEA